MPPSSETVSSIRYNEQRVAAVATRREAEAQYQRDDSLQQQLDIAGLILKYTLGIS